jgi:transcriptional regulator with XRE-family HTH domain
MGSRRPKTPRLAEKLLEIRQKLGLSQNEMVRRLGLEDEFDQERVSKYERAVLEPPLSVLCAYADAVNLYIDALARPELDLPNEIPARTRSAGVPRENPVQSGSARRKSEKTKECKNRRTGRKA